MMHVDPIAVPRKCTLRGASELNLSTLTYCIAVKDARDATWFASASMCC
ncbi:hypothetical protein XAP412_600008 [Xanthomonas phaseoli pv. phaseoli]|nr:hypothetical protein XAP412_600008 [Xanthomonas phaseoli pv. phaseoli]